MNEISLPFSLIGFREFKTPFLKTKALYSLKWFYISVIFFYSLTVVSLITGMVRCFSNLLFKLKKAYIRTFTRAEVTFYKGMETLL